MTTSSIFLSGEADPNLFSKRHAKLSDMLGSSMPVVKSSNNVHDNSGTSGSSVPLIQVVDESSFTSISDDENQTQRNDDTKSEGGFETQDYSHPISFMPATASNEMSITADKLPCAYESNVCTEHSSDPLSLMEQMMADAAISRAQTEKKNNAENKKRANNASFGLKKGFLTSRGGKHKNKAPKPAVAAKKYSEPPQQTTGKPSLGLKEKNCNDNINPTPSVRNAATIQSEVEDVFEIDSEGNMTIITKAEATSGDIPTIRPNRSALANETNPLRFAEVQEVMRNNSLEKLAVGEWATQDLMEKVSQNPRLLAGLSNPKFTAALEALRTNPKHALSKFKDHPDIVNFLNEFCTVMGEHFVTLGEKQSNIRPNDEPYLEPEIGPMAKKAVAIEAERRAQGQPSWKENIRQDELEKINEIMADPDLTNLLMDSDMQRVMQECSHPGRMAMYVQHPDYGPKLRRLVQAGLLKIA